MSILICGSLAYDSILRHSGRFRDHIAPAEETDQLNVSFHVHHLRREFGGCAGNIAYNLCHLGEDSYPMATVGKDFDAYDAWMKRQGVDRTYVHRIEGLYTSQAFIATDQNDNQITLFHPGAMDHSHVQEVPRNTGIRIGVVSPESRDAMRQHARQMTEAGIPMFFDPGQGMPMFGNEELFEFLEQARWLAVNDYESRMLQKKTGRTIPDLLGMLEAMIITHGGDGSEILRQDHDAIRIPAIEVKQAVDPTGCGDAYRAGVLYGLLRDWSWEDCGRLGTVLGSLAVEQEGCQNHDVSWQEVRARADAQFGSLPPD